MLQRCQVSSQEREYFPRSMYRGCSVTQKSPGKIGLINQHQTCQSALFPFSAIDGNYTEWTKWSDCSASCGGGSQTRTRTCTNPPPQYGGKNCEELGPDNQTQECNPDPCREFYEIFAVQLLSVTFER